MARQAGDGRGRLGGRTKGTANKCTSITREMLTRLTTETFDEFKQRLSDIPDPKQYCDVWLKLNKFVMPELSSIDMQADVKKTDLRDELEAIYKER